ncbi:MAG: hypothetical protein NC548_25570 [Lachnospiraceae bacterium]|nr:hypothetical protein [Lachnospiraceae bacterium]
MTLISKNDNSQTAFGTGRTTGYNGTYNAETNPYYGHIKTSGAADDTESLYKAGQFSGYKQSHGGGTHHVKVFHIEDFWGERWDRVLGLVSKHGVIYAKMTPEGDGYNLDGTGYETVTAHPIPLSTGDKNQGWIKDTYMSDFGRLPDEQLGNAGSLEGSDSTYVGDYHWINVQGNDTYLALCGGDCAGGSGCGSRALHLAAAASLAYWSLGASLTLV